MSKNLREAGSWRFSYRILLPIFLTVIGALGTIAAFIVWSTSRSDNDAYLRQTNLVAHMLREQQHGIIDEQLDVAYWDKTFEAVNATNIDTDFIENNLGAGMFEFFGHDRTYLLNPRLNAVYAMRDGGTVANSLYDRDRAVIEPMAKRLREINWQGGLAAYVNGASDNIPNVSDIVLIDGQPAFVSLMPIVSDDENVALVPGNEFLFATAEFLDASLAEELATLLQLTGARFGVDTDTNTDEVSLPLRNNAGDQVAYFAWSPDRPGARLLMETTPAIIIAVLLASLIIGMLILRLRRSTAELEEGRSMAQHMAHHDALTGLGNRAKFESRLETAISNINVERDDQVALLLLDLDRFKQVNDTLGHAAGDELIQQVAQRLQPLVRNADTIARLGGDEFVIIAEKVGSTENIAALCDRVLNSIRKPFDLSAGQAFVGVSIGVAVADDPAVMRSELVRKADIALYDAKGGGRNQYKIFESRMNEVVQERQALEDDLRAALRTDDQLDVSFQPLVRAEGSEIIGVEANICWEHPTRGNIPPSDFLPIAESCGLVELIGEFVLLRACQTAVQNPNQLMAVRVYPAQLRNPYFFDKVFSILDETGMQPKNLELEIGEKMLANSEELANATLRKLRHAGIRIALNDFGTGFTSLRLLQKFEVDRIKIDRSFISELAQSPDPEAITHAVVWLARAIGVEVSADGVDTHEQQQFLTRMGCMSFQGALFAPEGQASWLRHAANFEQNTKKPQEPADPLDDIEIWETGT